MRRTTTVTTLLLSALMVACGGNDDDIQPGTAMGDSLVPIADEALLPDTTPPAPPETVYTERPAAARPVAPRPRPTPPPAVTPTPPPAPASSQRQIASGTAFSANMIDSVHSRVTRVGDVVRVSVANDVYDAGGRVSIPAGAIVTLAVSEVAAAGSKNGAGLLTMAARSVSFGGQDYPISGRATDFEYELRGRGVGTTEVAKTAGGAAAGAIIGRVIGGRRGTLIGAIGGAAAGAAVADASQDRDVVLAAGKPVTITLSDNFSRSSE